MARCLALFSGGLDSILACRVMQQQGIDVLAIKFISPFFDYHLLRDKGAYQQEVLKKFKIKVQLHDISQEYLTMLGNPPHGYGKNFNPCVDCKILLIRKAKELMAKLSAQFLITGEVIGQRPMSQRKDTLRIIERDSNTDDILLRPLCAYSQKPTLPERQGVVDRAKLPRFSGRNRTPQMELAAQFGINDYPSPAGGCLLTEPERSRRIAYIYQHDQQCPGPTDILFLQQGRQFRLPHGSWFTLGRNQHENDQLSALAQHDDWQLHLTQRPGPFGLLRHCHHEEDKEYAASLVVHYGKKTTPPGLAGEVAIKQGNYRQTIMANPLASDTLAKLRFPPAQFKIKKT